MGVTMDKTIPRRPRVGPELVRRIHDLMTARNDGGGYAYTYQEVAEMTGVSKTTVYRIEKSRRQLEGAA